MISEGKRRLEEFDMVKGLIIIFIFFVHLCDTTGITELYLTYTNWVYSSVTLLFMVICFICSGYLYTQKRSVLAEITKKVRRLLVPRVLFSLFFLAVYFLVYVILGHKSLIWYFDNAVADFIGIQNWNIRLGQSFANPMIYAFVAFWFVDELFVAFCLFIPIRKLIDGLKIHGKLIATLVLLLIAMLFSYLDIQHTLETVYTTNVPYLFILINIFGIAGVMMIGNILREIHFFEPDKHSKKFMLIMAVLSFIILIIYSREHKATDYALQYGKWGEYGSLSIIMITLVALAFLYIMVCFFYYVKKIVFIKEFLSYAGKNTLDIMLLHIGVAEIISWIFGIWHDYYNEPFSKEEFSVTNCLIIFIGTAVVMYVFCISKSYLLNRKKRKTLA